MKNHIVLILTCIMSLLALTACGANNPQNVEPDGGKVDRSIKAPTEIKSKNIESFKTSFYLLDNFEESNSGSYSFSIEKNENGDYILSEDSHYNVSEKIDKSVLDKLQLIIEENNLMESNGIDEHTSGLPEEYAPCMLSCVYDSGEKLYFSEDNYPEAKWAFAMMELFKNEFVSLGHEELLPAAEDRNLVRFDMGYTDGVRDYFYATVFIENDNQEFSAHYLVNKCKKDSQEPEFDEVIEIPKNFFNDLAEEIGELGLEEYQNGEIAPGDTKKTDSYAYFCMEMESGLQKNAYYEGEDAKELTAVLEEIAAYIDVTCEL